LIFTSDTNPGGGFTAPLFSNTSNVLTFRNAVRLLANDTAATPFSFNATGFAPGIYNITISVLNSSGGV